MSALEDLILAFTQVTCSTREHARHHLLVANQNLSQALNDHFAELNCADEQSKNHFSSSSSSSSSSSTASYHSNENQQQQQQKKNENENGGAKVSSPLKTVMLSLFEPTQKQTQKDDENDDDCMMMMSDSKMNNNNNDNSKNNNNNTTRSTIDVDEGIEFLSVGTDFQLSQNQIRDVMKQQQHQQQQSKTKNTTAKNNKDTFSQQQQQQQQSSYNDINFGTQNSYADVDLNDDDDDLASFGEEQSDAELMSLMLNPHQSQKAIENLRRAHNNQSNNNIKNGESSGLPRRRTRSTSPTTKNSQQQKQNMMMMMNTSQAVTLDSSSSSSDTEEWNDNSNNKNGNDPLEKERRKLKREKQKLRQERMRLDALVAQNLAKEAELIALKQELDDQRAELESSKLVISLQKEELDLETAPPKHWTTIRILGNQAPAMVNIPRGSDMWNRIYFIFNERARTANRQHMEEYCGQLGNEDEEAAESEDFFKNYCYNNNNQHQQQGARPYTIEKIHRIENPVLWKLYAARRSAIAGQIGGHAPMPKIADFSKFAYRDLELQQNVNEALLFHGTNFNATKQIAGAGFDSRVSQSIGNFGQCLYYASESSKADSYTQPDENNLHYIFLCRVTLGTPYRLPEGNTFPNRRRPPCRNGCEWKILQPGGRGGGGFGRGVGFGWRGAARRRGGNRNFHQQQQQNNNDDPNDEENYISESIRNGRPVCDEHLLADSVIGNVNVGAPKEYCVFESNQVFPEFLVAYRR